MLGVDDRFWINIQTDYDLEVERDRHGSELEEITRSSRVEAGNTSRSEVEWLTGVWRYRMCHVGRMDTLPMFPLGSALLPGSPLPLQIFEPRYLAMLRDIAGGDGRFGVVLIERGVEVGGGDQRFATGTVATIEQMSPSADGRVRLLVRGQERFEVVRWLPDDPYPRAEVELLPDLEWSDEHTSDLAGTEHTVRRALTVMSEHRAQLWPADVELADDPVTRSWQLAGIAPLGALDQLVLLQSPSVGELLERTSRLTTEALDLLPLQLPDDPG